MLNFTIKGMVILVIDKRSGCKCDIHRDVPQMDRYDEYLKKYYKINDLERDFYWICSDKIPVTDFYYDKYKVI